MTDYKKKYKEALERAKQIQSTPYTAHWDVMKDVVEDIFPELKESEDEKIRNSLVEYFESHHNDTDFCGSKVIDILAWLEKQGEQKDSYTKQQLRDMGFAFTLNGDIVTPEETNEAIKLYVANEKKKWEAEQKPAWSEKDTEMLNVAMQSCEQCGNEYAYYWLKSLKERVQPQPKQEWSEEDKNNILFLTSIIEECFKDKEKITLYGDTVCANFTKEDVIDRLKSLRPQKQWKPTEEQIKALAWALSLAKSCGEECSFDLRTLHEQLKKLREE